MTRQRTTSPTLFSPPTGETCIISACGSLLWDFPGKGFPGEHFAWGWGKVGNSFGVLHGGNVNKRGAGCYPACVQTARCAERPGLWKVAPLPAHLTQLCQNPSFWCKLDLDLYLVLAEGGNHQAEQGAWG